MKSCVPYYTTIHTSGVTLSAPCSPSSQGAKFTEVRLFAVLVPPYTVTWGLHVAGPNVCSTCAVSNVAHCCHICPYRLLSEALRVPFSLTCSAYAGFFTGSMFLADPPGIQLHISNLGLCLSAVHQLPNILLRGSLEYVLTCIMTVNRSDHTSLPREPHYARLSLLTVPAKYRTDRKVYGVPRFMLGLHTRTVLLSWLRWQCNSAPLSYASLGHPPR